MRRFLINRFTLVLGAIVLVTLLWNAYVATHDHGIVTGRVVDADGKPAADASVALWVYNFTTYQEQMHVRTDSAGVFRFTDNPSHRIQLSAEKPGVGRSQRVPVFLYFRAEDYVLETPLRLASGG